MYKGDDLGDAILASQSNNDYLLKKIKELANSPEYRPFLIADSNYLPSFNLKVKYRKLALSAKVPTYAHEGDSGMDVYALNDEIIQAGEIRGIRTGISFEIPPGYEIQVRSKSGLALKYITVANSPGTVDSSYTGELVVILQNQSASWYQIGAGQKIAQIVFCPVVKAELEEVEEFKSTTRGDGGFGSTGLV